MSTDKIIIERDIYNHFMFMLETHEPDRAIILTSILFKVKEDEVQRICREGDLLNPLCIFPS